MCQSKSFLVLVVLFVSFINPCFPQVTKEQAIELIIAYVVAGNSPNYNVYLHKEQCLDEKFNLSPYDQIKNPFDKSWLFFIDTKPQYGWGHYCLYAFVQESTGNYSVIEKNMPPLNYWLSWEEISVPFPHQIVIQHTDTTIQNTLNFDPDPHKYALLICGNVRDDSARWNDFSHVYTGLKYSYGFTDDNIFVLSGDGHFDPDSMNLNLDGDTAYYDFDGPCNRDEIIDVFRHLDSVMTDKDIFLFYASTHGDTVVGSSTLTSLRLYNFEPLYDYELDSLADNLVCSEMIFCIDACYAGGMADNLTGSHRVIQVPVPRSMETIRGWKYFDFFTYGWATAMRGWHVSNVYTPWIPSEYKAGHHPNLVEIFDQWDDKVDMDPDSLNNGGNEDGFLQFGEVFNYAKYFDFRTDLYGSEYQNHGFRGDLLTLNGIEGRVDTTQSITGSYLFGRKLTLSPGVTLSKGFAALNFYLNESTEILIKDGAKLDIYGLTTNITGCAGESFVNVDGDLHNSSMNFSTINNAIININFINANKEYNLSSYDFDNARIKGSCKSLSLTSSTFTNSALKFSNGNLILSGPNDFDNSTINISNPSSLSSTCEISGATFDNDATVQSGSVISIENYPNFLVENCTINYAARQGILLNYAGWNNRGNHAIRHNTIHFTGTAYPQIAELGIHSYFSNPAIENNHISNNDYGITGFHGRNIYITGVSSAQDDEHTQLIENNTVSQCIFSYGSFPWAFHYNVLKDLSLGNKPFIKAVDYD